MSPEHPFLLMRSCTSACGNWQRMVSPLGNAFLQLKRVRPTDPFDTIIPGGTEFKRDDSCDHIPLEQGPQDP